MSESERLAASFRLAVAAALVAMMLAAPLAGAQEKEKPSVGYDKGFFVEDSEGLFKLKINAWFQGRFAFESTEEHVIETDDATGEAATLAGTEREEGYQFSLPRARLRLSGNVLSKRITYAFQTDFGKGDVVLKDYYGDIAFVPGRLHLRAGQWIRPFSRQQITSGGKLEMTDRAITDKGFGAGRDLGVAFHDDYEKSPPFEWVLGVFNGTGEKHWFEPQLSTDDASGAVTDVGSKSAYSNVPDRFHPMVVARIGYNHGGVVGYSEADLEGGPFRFSVGLDGLADFDLDGGRDSNLRGGLDFLLKVHGASLSGAAYVMSLQDGAGFDDQAYAAWGAHAQAGYVFMGKVQPVVRYAILDPKEDENNTQEILGGIAIYFFKHNVKWQTEAGGILREDAAGDLSDFVLRTQLQLGF